MANLHRLVLVIIQSLHNFFILKKRKQKQTNYCLVLLFLLSAFNSKMLNAQDSIPAKISETEKQNVIFQNHFFDALTQKAIRNYEKAINHLAECNQIIPNRKAVLFEISKNYLLLGRTFEALEYANQTILLDPENIYILEHIVDIYKKARNYKKAVAIQEKIAEKHPKKRRKVVLLLLRDNNVKEAKKVLQDLEKVKLLSPRLRRIKDNLFKKEEEKLKKTNTKSDENALLSFKKDKSFGNLKKLLNKLYNEKSKDLLSYSEKGLMLYPAQPLVYLMNGRALQFKNKHKKAIEILKTGLDFVIDDTKTENKFYKELSNCYKFLGNTKKEKEYLRKIN